MAANSRFPVAVHVLVALSYRPGRRVPSQALATSVRTHAVVVRRVLADLARAGLVRNQPGPGGGAALAMPAEEISLLDAFRAVSPGELFLMHRPNPHCPIGSRIPEVLGELLPEAESAFEESLEDISIAEISAQVLPGFARELTH